jgi:TatD DNase family protein
MTPRYIDIHAHINFKAFKEDGDEVMRRALDSDTWFFNVGSQYDTSKIAVEMAEKFDEGVYAVIGLHPIHLEEIFHDEDEIGPSFAKATGGQEGEGFTPVVDVGDVALPRIKDASPTFTTGVTSRAEVFDKQKYLELAKSPKVVAIGECGLDYFHMNPESVEKQKKAFVEQVEFAAEVGKPLMLHMRNSPTDKSRNVYADVAEILKNYPTVKGVSHCFGGSVEDMQRFVSIGIYVSFSGNITYKPRPDFDYISVIKESPLDMILTDTDSPYLSPVPHRGKRNEPSYVCEIVKKIAEIKNLPEEEVASAIVANAKRLFGI